MSPHSLGTEIQQLRMTVSPSHSSLAAKKALGVNLLPEVPSVISVAAHGTGQRKQEAKSKMKIQCIPDGMATGKASVYRSAQNHYIAKLWNALPISCKPSAGFRPRLETSRAFCGSFASQYTACQRVCHTCVQTGACLLHMPQCFCDVTNKNRAERKGHYC